MRGGSSRRGRAVVGRGRGRGRGRGHDGGTGPGPPGTVLPTGELLESVRELIATEKSVLEKKVALEQQAAARYRERLERLQEQVAAQPLRAAHVGALTEQAREQDLDEGVIVVGADHHHPQPQPQPQHRQIGPGSMMLVEEAAAKRARSEALAGKASTTKQRTGAGRYGYSEDAVSSCEELQALLAKEPKLAHLHVVPGLRALESDDDDSQQAGRVADQSSRGGRGGVRGRGVGARRGRGPGSKAGRGRRRPREAPEIRAAKALVQVLEMALAQKQVRSLAFTGATLTDDLLRRLAYAGHHLVHLDLSHALIGMRGVQALLQLFDREAAREAAAISTRARAHRKQGLRRNPRRPQARTPAAAAHRNAEHARGEQSVEDAEYAYLLGPCRLASLVLRYNNLYDTVGPVLARAVAGSPTLTNLDVSHNHLTDRSLHVLAYALEDSALLMRLDVTHNPHTAAGAGLVAAAATRCSRPVTILVSPEQSGEWLQPVQRALHMRRLLQARPMQVVDTHNQWHRICRVPDKELPDAVSLLPDEAGPDDDAANEAEKDGAPPEEEAHPTAPQPRPIRGEELFHLTRNQFIYQPHRKLPSKQHATNDAVAAVANTVATNAAAATAGTEAGHSVSAGVSATEPSSGQTIQSQEQASSGDQQTFCGADWSTTVVWDMHLMLDTPEGAEVGEDTTGSAAAVDLLPSRAKKQWSVAYCVAAATDAHRASGGRRSAWQRSAANARTRLTQSDIVATGEVSSSDITQQQHVNAAGLTLDTDTAVQYRSESTGSITPCDKARRLLERRERKRARREQASAATAATAGASQPGVTEPEVAVRTCIAVLPHDLSRVEKLAFFVQSKPFVVTEPDEDTTSGVRMYRSHVSRTVTSPPLLVRVSRVRIFCKRGQALRTLCADTAWNHGWLRGQQGPSGNTWPLAFSPPASLRSASLQPTTSSQARPQTLAAMVGPAELMPKWQNFPVLRVAALPCNGSVVVRWRACLHNREISGITGADTDAGISGLPNQRRTSSLAMKKAVASLRNADLGYEWCLVRFRAHDNKTQRCCVVASGVVAAVDDTTGAQGRDHDGSELEHKSADDRQNAKISKRNDSSSSSRSGSSSSGGSSSGSDSSRSSQTNESQLFDEHDTQTDATYQDADDTAGDEEEKRGDAGEDILQPFRWQLQSVLLHECEPNDQLLLATSAYGCPNAAEMLAAGESITEHARTVHGDFLPVVVSVKSFAVQDAECTRTQRVWMRQTHAASIAVPIQSTDGFQVAVFS